MVLSLKFDIINKYLRQGTFKGVVGVLDDPLINARIPIDKQVPFRGRGGYECFQNLMATI